MWLSSTVFTRRMYNESFWTPYSPAVHISVFYHLQNTTRLPLYLERSIAPASISFNSTASKSLLENKYTQKSSSVNHHIQPRTYINTAKPRTPKQGRMQHYRLPQELGTEASARTRKHTYPRGLLFTNYTFSSTSLVRSSERAHVSMLSVWILQHCHLLLRQPFPYAHHRGNN